MKADTACTLKKQSYLCGANFSVETGKLLSRDSTELKLLLRRTTSGGCRTFNDMQEIELAPRSREPDDAQASASAAGQTAEFGTAVGHRVAMRYEEKVDKWRTRRRATHTMRIHSRRLLRFLKRDYHVTNLALAFLSRVGHEYKERRDNTTTAFVVCEAFIGDIGQKTAQAVAERNLAPAQLDRVHVNFTVLSPNSVRLARLLQEADGILERLVLLELENLIAYSDRVLLTRQMLDAFTAIKEAALGHIDDATGRRAA